MLFKYYKNHKIFTNFAKKARKQVVLFQLSSARNCSLENKSSVDSISFNGDMYPDILSLMVNLKTCLMSLYLLEIYLVYDRILLYPPLLFSLIIFCKTHVALEKLKLHTQYTQ